MSFLQISLSTLVMRRLIPLQEQVCHGVKEDCLASKEKETGRRRRTSSRASTTELHAILRLLKKHRSRPIPSYITCKKLGNGELVECKACDFEFPNDADIHDELFTKVRWKNTNALIGL